MKGVLSIVLTLSMIIPAISGKTAVSAEGNKENAAGYLAVYTAEYEPDLGAEYAQFPSKQYTDTYRTDVLYYALSKDGKNFTAMNNNKAVYYPEGYYKLGSPFVYRTSDGYYGLIASVDNKGEEVIVCDSDEMLYFYNQRRLRLNDEGIAVMNPTVKYDAETNLYNIFWEGDDGNSYVNTTESFVTVSEHKQTDYKKESVTLPDTVDVVYSDGSKTPMSITWNTNGLSLTDMAKGEYEVTGTIQATTEYNSPLANYRADPYAVYDEENKVYYFTGSNLNENSANGGGAYENLVIRVTESLNDISDAEEYVIWRDKTLSDGTKVTGWYWAPEIHKMDDKWRMIAKAEVTEPNGNSGGRQCIFTCVGDDITDEASWEYTGYIFDADGFPVCNLSLEEYLAESLKNVTVKIYVGKENTSVTPAPQTSQVSDDTNDTTQTAKVGDVKKVGNLKYKIIKTASSGIGSVSVCKAVKKSVKKITIPNKVKISGKTYKVTEIGKKAFWGCKNLKKIVIKAASLKKVGKNAFKNTSKKLVIICPSKKLKKYKNLIANKGNTIVKCK